MNEDLSYLTFYHDPKTRVTWCNEDERIWIDELIGVRSEKSYLLTIGEKKIGFGQGDTFSFRKENPIYEKYDHIWLIGYLLTNPYARLSIPVVGHSPGANTFCFESFREQNLAIDILKKALSVRPIFSTDEFDKAKYGSGIPVLIDPKLRNQIDSRDLICG